MPQDGVATTMATLEMLPVRKHVDDVIIENMAMRVTISTRTPPKGGGDERWVSKPKKSEVSEATNMMLWVQLSARPRMKPTSLLLLQLQHQN